MIDLAGDLASILGGELGEDALYIPRTGGELAIKVIRRRPDEITAFGDAQIVSTSSVFLVAVADVEEPGPGDQIEVGGIVHEVQAVPTRDARRLRWRIEAWPVE